MDHKSFHLAAVHELIGAGGVWKDVLWGDLAGMPIADLLNVLSHGNRTGLLLVRGEDESERALGFHNGFAVWSASSEPSEHTARDMALGLVQQQKGEFTYLRHLFAAQELLSFRLNSIHNLTFYLDLMRGLREAIEAGCAQKYAQHSLEGFAAGE